MKDQTMALEWVNENIEQFGGDKNRITLMGHSSGEKIEIIIMYLNWNSRNFETNFSYRRCISQFAHDFTEIKAFIPESSVDERFSTRSINANTR